MVTHPAPPQTRTCAIHAYGSSSRAAAAPGAVQWGSGDTIGERKVSLVSLAHWKPCSTSPSLPWVPWALVPHLPQYSATLRLPSYPSRVASLVARFPIPCVLPSFVVSLPGSGPRGKLPGSRQGFCSPGPPFRVCRQGDRWLSQVPEFPLWRHAPLSDPGGVLGTCHDAPRTTAFQRMHTVGFPQLYPFRGSITRPVSSLHPAPYGPLRGGTRVRY